MTTFPSEIDKATYLQAFPAFFIFGALVSIPMANAQIAKAEMSATLVG